MVRFYSENSKHFTQLGLIRPGRFLSNIYTLIHQRACRLEQMGIRPPTVQIVGDLLYHLSYSHPNKWEAKGQNLFVFFKRQNVLEKKS